MKDIHLFRAATLTLAVAAVAGFGALWSPAVPAGARPPGVGEGLKPIAMIPFENGTHLEVTTIKGRDYAFATDVDPGSLRVIDVTVPQKPRVVAKLRCGGFQGNVQISHDKKTLLIGLDAPSKGGCMPVGQMGFVTIDISKPSKPRPVGYATIERGSHSLATHPSKPYVYNGEGFPETSGEMQVWSIADPARPKLVTTLDTGAHSPHDLAFNKDGSMAATANVVNFHVLDTTNPVDPKIVATSQCPGCLHTHEARFTPDGKKVIVNDEYPAAPTCPTGGLYFYDLSRDHQLTLTGAYLQGEKGANANNEAGFCTPHVFDISEDGMKLATSWHTAGIKYLDISDTSGITVGAEQVVPGGPKELGWYANRGGDAFTAKLHEGPYIYTVDVRLGFQIFKIDRP
ncbi:MAG: hypothetical protein M3N53_15195 [Actinomycetota bacterium]|nr:hypothetical protein [Actinomycetota bacterium]